MPGTSRRLAVLLVLVVLAAAGRLAEYYGPSQLTHGLFQTLLALAIAYALFRVIAEQVGARRIRDAKTRYALRKALSVTFWAVSVIAIVRIWVPDPQALMVAYGLVGAGVAIALQDLFKNIAGGFVLFLGGAFRVGDRIAVGALRGDVIDVGMLYTSLLEIGEWVDGDQATGRISIFPNGLVLSSTVHNYTKDHGFLWDEIVLPITYDSDWKTAQERIREIVSEATSKDTDAAKREVQRLEEKYYLSPRNIEPAVFIAPNDNWIAFHIRYVTRVRDRRLVRDRLSHEILAMIERRPDIHIASQTLMLGSVGNVRPRPVFPTTPSADRTSPLE